ncbi:MAG: hypothetical protein GY936_12065 [Ignavibacteriae bacterium]|nr:hypothetical protein [Ignavibacteriota bacterium]
MKKTPLLVLFISLISIFEVSAQKNRMGVGLNQGTTWGASRGEITRTTIGLKLFYDGEISSDLRLRMNLDVDLPTEMVQHAIEITALYNLSLSNEVKFLLGGGAGYYLQTDVEDRLRYYSENNYSVIYKPFDGGNICGRIYSK